MANGPQGETLAGDLIMENAKGTNAYWLEKAKEWREANPHLKESKVPIGIYKREWVYAPREQKK